MSFIIGLASALVGYFAAVLTGSLVIRRPVAKLLKESFSAFFGKQGERYVNLILSCQVIIAAGVDALAVWAFAQGSVIGVSLGVVVGALSVLIAGLMMNQIISLFDSIKEKNDRQG